MIENVLLATRAARLVLGRGPARWAAARLALPLAGSNAEQGRIGEAMPIDASRLFLAGGSPH
jgi:hypothetical protein